MTEQRGAFVEVQAEERLAERAADADGTGPGGLPRDTAPTFELEMLVSGAVLVGLFQLEGALDGAVARWLPHLALVGTVGVVLTASYVRAAIYALIACFVTHLALRGYWVALVAVNAMFPGGVRWERTQETGPITRNILRTRLRPLSTLAARYDNAASLVFAAGFILAFLSLSSLAFFVIAGAAYGVFRAAHAPRPELAAFATLAIPVVAMFGAWMLDLRRGDRLSARAATIVRRISVASQRVQPASLSSLMYVVRTNIDGRAAYGVLFVGLTLALVSAGASGPQLSGRSLPNARAYRFFADESDTRSVHAHFYDALRGDEPASVRAPSIQSDIITDPYIRLFVPYIPSRHEEALARACPGLAPAPAADSLGESAADAAANTRILRCAAQLHRPTLDGRPLDSIGFHFFSDPRTNRRGFRMLVPTAGLAPGEHHLAVWPVPAPGQRASAAYVIPFWR